MLVISDELICQIITHAKEGEPKEVCGWLAGKGNRATRTYPVPNASKTPEHEFRMEPEAQLRAMLEIREASLELTATYHSHPRTPAESSARDLALRAYPNSFHVIVSLASTEPEIRCYRITEQGCQPTPLLIERAYRGGGAPRCS